MLNQLCQIDHTCFCHAGFIKPSMGTSVSVIKGGTYLLMEDVLSRCSSSLGYECY